MPNNHEFTEMGDEELGLSEESFDDKPEQGETMYPASVIEEALENMQVDLNIRINALNAASRQSYGHETASEVISMAAEFEKYLRNN